MTSQPSFFSSGSKCTVRFENGALKLKTPYDPALVAAIKQLPSSERRFDPSDPDHKVWIIDPKHANKIEGWIAVYFNEMIVIPSVQATKPQTTLRLLEVHYIGTCKDRDGESQAFGCDANTNWIYVFPESILRGFFDGTEENTAPTAEKTLYAILGVKTGALQDEIRTAYRRMAKTWHPDVCREQNAKEIFLRIQEAYSILSDPRKQARYNAGLALEASLGNHPQRADINLLGAYRSPLRCGQIMAEGTEIMGRFKVSNILVWEDVYNRYGQTLISSWPMGANEPVKVWA